MEQAATPKIPLALLTVLYGCGFIAGFNENLVNMALVAIMNEFSVDAVTVQWLVTGYMIAATVVIICMSFCYRRFTLHALFLGAAALSIVGSALGFIAGNFFAILAGRLIQAIGTGMFIPLMMNVIVDKVPFQKMGTYVSLGGSMITLGPATAPIVTGFLVSAFGWRSVFLVPLGVTALLLVVGLFIVRDDRAAGEAHFDVLSVAFAAAGITLLTFGLAQVSSNVGVGIGALAVAVLVMFLFVRRQLMLEYPLVSMEPMRNATYWPAVVLVIVTMMTYFSFSVMAPLYFEEGAGLTPATAGLLMVIPVLTNATAALVGGRVLDKRGEWPLLPLGLFLAAVGVVVMIIGAVGLQMIIVTIGIFIGYLGTGMVLSPAQSAGLKRLPNHLNADGVALMTSSVQLASCVGPAAYIGVMSALQNSFLEGGAPDQAAASYGFAGAMMAALVIVVLGLICAWRYARRMRTYKVSDAE